MTQKALRKNARLFHCSVSSHPRGNLQTIADATADPDSDIALEWIAVLDSSLRKYKYLSRERLPELPAILLAMT